MGSVEELLVGDSEVQRMVRVRRMVVMQETAVAVQVQVEAAVMAQVESGGP
jgi:hypothetical protein